MRTILTIIGARPQFIKAAPVSRALSKRKNLKEWILHTGQHYDKSMSGVFFNELGIPKPYRKLSLSRKAASHGTQTAQMMLGIEKACLDLTPDVMLVYGDTNSTLAASLVAAKLGIPIAHVEAGLRSFNRMMPEEINRVITDRLSTYLFTPTATATKNLRDEGIQGRVFEVGDVMLDAIHAFFSASLKRFARMKRKFSIHAPFFLLTLHRQENSDDPRRLKNILGALGRSPVPFMFPVHPRTGKNLTRHRVRIPENIKIVAPLTYLESLFLQNAALAVWTDSGGVQKEAAVFQKPCFTLRAETEWVETVQEGVNHLVDADPVKIGRALRAKVWLKPMAFPTERYYGNGRAAERIADILTQVLHKKVRTQRR